MEFFFNPKSIAVIGATPNPLKGGNAIIKNLIRAYSGYICPVNPNYMEVEGLQCFQRVSHIDKPVDLAIIFIPAHLVPEALQDCAVAGVKGVMIESGGFAEIGEEGRALQEQCRAIGEEASIRLWGPNCMGLLDARKNFVFSFLAPNLWEEGLTPGTVSLIVQSGMLSGSFIVDLMSHGTTGVSKVCSIGNKVDVDECDLLDYLVMDPETTVVALYLEGIPKGRTFIEIAARSTKPIVVLKGGRSPRGARAAMSHTASLAGNDRIVRGAFAQAGIVQATDFHQMMDMCRALAIVPEGTKQGRIAVLTFTGSGGILSADFFDSYGMALADLSAETCRRLKEFFPSWMPVANPVDLWPAAEILGGEAYRRAAEIVLKDPGVDALLVQTFVGGFRLDLNLEILATLSRKNGKPIFFWILGMGNQTMEFQKRAQELGMPVYHELSRAVEAIHAVHSSGIRGGGAGVEESRGSISVRKSPALHEMLGQMASAQGPLDEFDSKKVLTAVGIPTVSEAIATDSAEALEIAQRIGFPVVLKGLVPGKIHKTELGLIKLNLQNPDEVLLGFEELTSRLKGHGRILVQKYFITNLEFICGMIRDPQFGPSVMFGLGGVMVELYQDVVFRIAPLNEQRALEMIDSIRAKNVLAGFRGGQPVDREALAQVLMALGWIGLEASRVAHIDINPLAETGGKVLALDATVILGHNGKVDHRKAH